MKQMSKLTKVESVYETGNQILEVSSSDESDSDGCRSFGSNKSFGSDKPAE